MHRQHPSSTDQKRWRCPSAGLSNCRSPYRLLPKQNMSWAIPAPRSAAARRPRCIPARNLLLTITRTRLSAPISRGLTHPKTFRKPGFGAEMRQNPFVISYPSKLAANGAGLSAGLYAKPPPGPASGAVRRPGVGTHSFA